MLGVPLGWSLVLLQHHHFDGLAQDYSNSIANALELLQSCTKPSIYHQITPGKGSFY